MIKSMIVAPVKGRVILDPDDGMKPLTVQKTVPCTMYWRGAVRVGDLTEVKSPPAKPAVTDPSNK